MSLIEAITDWVQEFHPDVLKSKTKVVSKVNKQGKKINTTESINDPLLDFLYENVENGVVELLTTGRVLFPLTQHECVCRLDLIQQHLNGKAYKKALSLVGTDEANWKDYEPYITPHKSTPNKLFCTLTLKTLNKNKQEVDKHVAGFAYQRALKAIKDYEEEQRVKREERRKQRQAKALLFDRLHTVGTNDDKYDFSNLDFGAIVDGLEEFDGEGEIDFDADFDGEGEMFDGEGELDLMDMDFDAIQDSDEEEEEEEEIKPTKKEASKKLDIKQPEVKAAAAKKQPVVQKEEEEEEEEDEVVWDDEAPPPRPNLDPKVLKKQGLVQHAGHWGLIMDDEFVPGLYFGTGKDREFVPGMVNSDGFFIEFENMADLFGEGEEGDDFYDLFGEGEEEDDFEASMYDADGMGFEDEDEDDLFSDEDDDEDDEATQEMMRQLMAAQQKAAQQKNKQPVAQPPAQAKKRQLVQEPVVEAPQPSKKQKQQQQQSKKEQELVHLPPPKQQQQQSKQPKQQQQQQPKQQPKQEQPKQQQNKKNTKK